MCLKPNEGYLYESFGVTIATLITTLLAVAAVYVSLWITGTEFNITSRMGMNDDCWLRH